MISKKSLLLSFFFALQFPSVAFSQTALESTARPDSHYLDTHSPKSMILRVKKDFNNDGREDVAYSSLSQQGNSGGFWWIYLAANEGRYSILSKPFRFHPLAIYIDSSSGVVSVYNRQRPQMGFLETYKFEKNDFSLQEKKPLSMLNPKDNKTYRKLFLRKDRKKTFKKCELKRFKKGNCIWR